MNSIRSITRHPLLWPVLTCLALIAVNVWFNPHFLSITDRGGQLSGALIDIINRAAPLMLVALGMTLVIAVRGIDISAGATVAISGAVAATLIGNTVLMTDGQPSYLTQTALPWAILGALGAATLCGMWNGLLVAGTGIQPIIATLILMVAGRGIAQLLSNGQILTIHYPPYLFIGSGHLFGLPFALYIAAAVLAGLLLLKRYTAMGLFLQATGTNPEAARFAGVRTRLITFCAYTFCGLMAGLAGLIISANVRSADGNNAGLMLELDAILAVALGGTSLAGGRFSLIGSIIGALIIQTLTYTIYSIGVPPEVNMAVKAIVVFLVCLMQSPEFRTLLWRRPVGEATE